MYVVLVDATIRVAYVDIGLKIYMLNTAYISPLFLRMLGLGDNEVTLLDEGILVADEDVVDNMF